LRPKASQLNFVDAHVHLSDPEYNGHIDELIEDAQASKVEALVSNSVDLQTSRQSLQLAQKHSGLVFAALGIHPWNVSVLKEGELDEILRLIQDQFQKGNVTAIGEIGLDIKYERQLDKQMIVFTEMLHTAERLSIPVVIHSRGTTARIIEMLPSYNLKRVLLHWFSYPITALHKAVSHGYFITEGPPTTYSNGIREVVAQVPLTNLLTETDGPVKYYKPPFKGQITKPSYIRNVVEAVAEIKKIPLDDAADQIAKNFETFFNVKLA
jgi:TatD DNase family protein